MNHPGAQHSASTECAGPYFGENMSGMAKWRRFRTTPTSEMIAILVITGLMMQLLSLGFKDWAVGIMFIVLISYATIKVFLAYRRKGDVIASDSTMNSIPKSN